MIITTTDFEYGAYIANRDDAPNSDIIGNEPVLQGFIDEYSEKCLVETLGWELFALLKEQLVDGLLPGTADQIWLDLVNGKDAYRGMKKGMLVGYVYYFFMHNDTLDTSTQGVNRVTSEGSQIERPDSKMNLQYRKFYEQAVGEYFGGPTILTKSDGRTGVLWAGNGSGYQSMFDFLRVNADTYPTWSPNLAIKQANVYGI